MSEDFDEMLQKDTRYKLGAYEFVVESLNFAQNVLNNELELGEPSKNDEDEPPAEAIRHVSGQQFCKMMRMYAIKQYGFLALTVLQSWGINTTHDFGQIVFNLVKCGKLQASPEDKIEDFDNVYDFEQAFSDCFKFD